MLSRLALTVRIEAPELLDRAWNDPAELAANLADLRNMNHFLGWNAGICQAIEEIVRRRRIRSFSVLDVATGSADLPLAVLRYFGRRGYAVRAFGSDRNAQVLRLAASRLEGAAVDLILHDGLQPPFRPKSFDVVVCSLALHHFAPKDATALLRDLASLGRVGMVVGDLERSASAYAAAHIAGLVVDSALTRHDGPVSVKRAYTVAELRSLGRAAGLATFRVRRQFPFRMILLAEHLETDERSA